MKDFIEFVVKQLVDHPDEVTVREVEGERAVILEVRLNSSDIGKVIGKSGKTINAIRSLLACASAKRGKRAILEIIEPEGQGRPPSQPAEPSPPAEPSQPAEPSGNR